MAVLRQSNNPDSGGTSPGNPGVLQFYKEGFGGAATGWQVDSEGNITTAGTVTAAGGIVSNGPASYTGALAATVVLSAKVTADVANRLEIRADGQLQWGDGTAAVDTVLQRGAAGQITLPGTRLLATRAAAANPALAATVTNDTVNRFEVLADGKLQWGTGALAADANLYRATTDQLATDDDFLINAAGKGLRVKEGSNAKMGLTAAMTAGTIVVSTTAVTANSRIFLTAQNTGGTPDALRVSARTPGTSFTITSANAADTSTVAWLIFEPA